MTARVVWVSAEGESWTVTIRRNRDLDIDRTHPPVTDLPEDIRNALRVWLQEEPF